MSQWAVLGGGGGRRRGQRRRGCDQRTGQGSGRRQQRRRVSTATKKRRTALEALSIGELLRWAGPIPAPRPVAAEIRGMIDQSVAPPELAESWIDGTFRDLPDDALGFAAFSGFRGSGAPEPAAKKA